MVTYAKRGPQVTTPPASPPASMTLRQFTLPQHILADRGINLHAKVLILLQRTSRRSTDPDGWTPPVTNAALAAYFHVSTRTIRGHTLGLVDHGAVDRRPVQLERGGWSWQYREARGAALAAEGAQG